MSVTITVPCESCDYVAEREVPIDAPTVADVIAELRAECTRHHNEKHREHEVGVT